MLHLYALPSDNKTQMLLHRVSGCLLNAGLIVQDQVQENILLQETGLLLYQLSSTDPDSISQIKKITCKV